MSRIRKVVMEIDEASDSVSCTFVTCCVSWEEMLEAVVQMRDKLNEQIQSSGKCPFSPAQSDKTPKAM